MVLNANPDWPKSSYDSRINNIVTEFFIPALKKSTTYKRIAGLFSSTSFSLCARGISELVANDGNMQLIISPILKKEDIIAIKDVSQEKFEKIIENLIKNELLTIESGFEKDHIFALKYLLKYNYLEIRIDIPKDEFGNPMDAETIIDRNVLAEKRGVFQDREGYVVSFRGPIDASKESWEKGIFSITVDTSWDPGQEPHVKDDIAIFEKLWKSSDTIKLSEALKNELIIDAPKKEDVTLQKYDVPPWAILSNDRILWPNQIRAVNAWVNNDYRGIFSIATSGGKTLAAIVSANLLPKNVLILVVVPGLDLAEQWNKEIKEYDSNAEILICNSNYDWKQNLTMKLNKFMKGKNEFSVKNRNYVIVTDATGIMPVFLENFRYVDKEKIMVIGDEVHHLGATENRKILEIESTYRLGLSATYRRGWDEIGTNAIINYFGRSLSEAEYTITEGIKDGKLSKYTYYPFFVTLEDDEFEEYYKITLDIAKLFSKNENSQIEQIKNEKTLEILYNKRADILKKAKNKIQGYKEIIKQNPKSPFIVFADDNEQVDELGIAHKEVIAEINKTSKIILKDDLLVFSGKTGRWERKKILEQAVGHNTPIFAMYCLDEGIDVPEFNAAILVSSSKSKRQYIQRRGRILRIGKIEKTAQLFDIVVLPKKQDNVGKNKIAEDAIRGEYERIEELSFDALNKYEALELFRQKKFLLGYE